MSTQLRGTRWHYRFMLRGKSYSGPCENCENKREANEYERCMRKKTEDEARKLDEVKADIRKNKTVAALVENYRRELSGGKDITLKEAFELARKKPSRREVCKKVTTLRGVYWNDFVSFMQENHADVINLAQIKKSHCEEYLTKLIQRGKDDGEKKLSPSTIRNHVVACKWVISRVEEDAGIMRNPFSGIVLPEPDHISREVFTMDELNLIWNGLQTDDFLRPLFIIAANSGLTEGDICTLKWSDIDFTASMIRKKRRKTGVDILLPLLPELANYLMTFPRTSEYILPEHAQLYLGKAHMRNSISNRIIKFLEGLGIKTKLEREGMKAVSIKDLHSMRHIFCYRAKKAGISETLIQRMVGHAVLEMTKHYADHDTEDDMRREIKKLPALFFNREAPDSSSELQARNELAELAMQLPIDVVNRILEAIKKAHEVESIRQQTVTSVTQKKDVLSTNKYTPELELVK